MFLVTNRVLHPRKSGLAQLGDTPNSHGPNELRLARAERRPVDWALDILPDRLTPDMKSEIGRQGAGVLYASKYVAWHLNRRLREGKRNLLFFVHGFNNDVQAVLDRAELLERLYDVEVVPFTWPANGGGVRGVASYKSDKRDAHTSAGALSRTFEKARALLDDINHENIEQARQEARDNFPDNLEKQDTYVTRVMNKGCPFTVNLMLHSMGNYVFKQVMTSTAYDGNRLLFDNVVMVAADVNNHDHVPWVDRINCRRRVYITINEDDSALGASRMKSGEEQRARLGHHPHNLSAVQAVYVDFTGAPRVGNSHAYFEDAAVEDRNGDAFRFFRGALNGERVEQDLSYNAAKNLYRIG